MNRRTVWAVLAGVLFTIIVTTLVDVVYHLLGVFPAMGQPLDDRLSLVATSYRVPITVAAGWLTARLAPDRPMRHAMILGVIGTAFGLIGVVATWNAGLGPRWYPIAVAVMAIPLCWAGGKLHEMGAPRHRFTPGLDGWITHTDLASGDPAATRAWCVKVLGWKFKPSFAGPAGEIHLFAYSDQGGGGIRPLSPPEQPGSIPYIHVASAETAFASALREGAEAMLPPTRVMEGVTVAIVRAPGGVPIGFSGP